MPTAVREVPPTSLGSGARLQEFFKLPRWSIIIILSIRGIFRHYLLNISFIAIIFLWYVYGLSLWWLAICSVVGLWVFGIGSYWLIMGGRFKTAWWYLILIYRWRHAVVNVGLGSRDKLHVPRISRVRPIKDGLRFRVNMRCAGRVVNDLKAEADDICEVIGFQRVQVFGLSPGIARMVLLWTKEQISQSTVSDSVDFGSTTRSDLNNHGDHTRLRFGKTPSGEATLSLVTSLLIVGLSNTGKTNILKAIMHGLTRQEIPHKDYVIDDKGGVSFTELEHSPNTVVYCDRAGGADAVIDRAHRDMWERAAKMRKRKIAGNNEKILPSDEYPLCIVWIDELLLLTSQIKAGVEGKLSELAIVGREFMFVAVACSQGSQIKLLGNIRDAFPQRICLATGSTGTTDACLGDNAESNGGAKCSQIPLSMPGVGYYKNEDGRGYTRFRADEVKGSLLTGIVGVDVPDKNSNKRCAVYRYYNVTGRAWYFGKAFNPEERAKRHAVNSLWWGSVDHTRTKIDWYINEAAALEAETQFIQAEDPVHNQRKRNLAEISVSS